jgi:hypothetical protein
MTTRKYSENDFNPVPKPVARQPQRKWSLTTLMAARPNPKHDTRRKAIEWNQDFWDVPQVQVDPMMFPIKQDD